MTIAVPTGCSLDDIVDYVLQATIRRETPTSMVRHLTTDSVSLRVMLNWHSTAHAVGLFALRLDGTRTVRLGKRTQWRG